MDTARGVTATGAARHPTRLISRERSFRARHRSEIAGDAAAVSACIATNQTPRATMRLTLDRVRSNAPTLPRGAMRARRPMPRRPAGMNCVWIRPATVARGGGQSRPEISGGSAIPLLRWRSADSGLVQPPIARAPVSISRTGTISQSKTQENETGAPSNPIRARGRRATFARPEPPSVFSERPRPRPSSVALGSPRQLVDRAVPRVRIALGILLGFAL